jgi:hypothetical protein
MLSAVQMNSKQAATLDHPIRLDIANAVLAVVGKKDLAIGEHLFIPYPCDD